VFEYWNLIILCNAWKELRDGKAQKVVVEEKQKVTAADQLHRDLVDEYNVSFEFELHFLVKFVILSPLPHF